MRRFFISLLAVVTILSSLCYTPVVTEAVNTDDCGFYLMLRDEYTSGDKSFTVDLYMNSPVSDAVSCFGLLLDYSSNVSLSGSEALLDTISFSRSTVSVPYKILGVADRSTDFIYALDNTVIASFVFSVTDLSYSAPIDISVEIDPVNNVYDVDGNIIDEIVSTSGLSFKPSVEEDDSPVQDDNFGLENIPDYNDNSYTGSDSIYINENFVSLDNLTKDFMLGAFYIEDGLLCGWNEAKTLQSQYDQTSYNGNSIFNNKSPYTWLTFDASVTLSLADDPSTTAARWINLCYCNDNMVYAGTSSDRQFISFAYDIEAGCFRLTNGWSNSSSSGQLMTPVYKDICTDGSEFMSLGISVGKNRIRCFYNNELIFDYSNSSFYIGQYVNAPFFLWNDGNIFKSSNITIAEEGYLYSEYYSGIKNFVIGNDGFLVNYYGSDTNVTIPNRVIKIGKFSFLKNTDVTSVFVPGSVKEIETGAFYTCPGSRIYCYSNSAAQQYAEKNRMEYSVVFKGDSNNDGMLTMNDVTHLSRFINGATVEIGHGADMNADGSINMNDLTLLIRIINGVTM